MILVIFGWIQDLNTKHLLKCSPLFFKGHIKVVKFLADLEIISIDLRTKKGETACDIAKRNGHQNVVDFLNSWRISPNRLPHETRHSIYILGH